MKSHSTTASMHAPAAPVSANQAALQGAVSCPLHRLSTVLGRQRRASDRGLGASLPRAGGAARVPRSCVDRSAGAVMCISSIPDAAIGKYSAGIATHSPQDRAHHGEHSVLKNRTTLHFTDLVVSKKVNMLSAFYRQLCQ